MSNQTTEMVTDVTHISSQNVFYNNIIGKPCNDIIFIRIVKFSFPVYPRQVLAFGYCCCPRVCVCVHVSVNHEFIRVITHQTFNLGSPNLDQRCKRPRLRALLFCGMIDCDLQGQIELQSKKVTPFWACACHNSLSIEATFSKFGTKMHLSTVQIPTNFGFDWNWSSIQFLISNPAQIEIFMYISGIL